MSLYYVYREPEAESIAIRCDGCGYSTPAFATFTYIHCRTSDDIASVRRSNRARQRKMERDCDLLRRPQGKHLCLSCAANTETFAQELLFDPGPSGQTWRQQCGL